MPRSVSTLKMVDAGRLDRDSQSTLPGPLCYIVKVKSHVVVSYVKDSQWRIQGDAAASPSAWTKFFERLYFGHVSL